MSSQNTVIVIVFAILSIGVLLISLGITDDDERIAKADRSIDDLALTLTRTACFGTCPVYTLSIANDNSVRFEGIAFTDVEGVVESTLTHDQMAAITEDIVRSNFFGHKHDDKCIVFATDHPSVKLDIRWHRRERIADVNLGCQKRRPDPVPGLADRVDHIVNTMQWIGDTPKEWR